MPSKSKVPSVVNKQVVNNFALPVAAILISILLFIFLIIPKTLNYFQTSSTISDTQTETAKLTALASSLERIDISQYQDNLTSTEKVLPADIKATSAINQVQAVLAQNNLQLTALTFSNSGLSSTQVKGPASSFNLALETAGDLDSIKNFANQIESAPQIMRLNDLSVSLGKDGKSAATMSLTVYYQNLAQAPKSFTTPVTDLSSQDQADLSKIQDRANQPTLSVASPEGTLGKPNPFQ